MASPAPLDTTDRHALVTALWLAVALVAAALFDFSFGTGGAWTVGAGFAAVLAGFVAHILVNTVYGTWFTAGELALGLVAYAAGLVAFVLAVLMVPGFAERNFAPLSIGFLVVFVAVVFFMVTQYGVRPVFTAFDVIRDFRPRDREDDA